MSTPNYSQILIYRYPDLQWRMEENDYSTLVVLAGVKPTQAELDALWPGVDSEVNSLSEIETKTETFQRSYSMQTQLIGIMRAISTGDKTVINEMLTTWDNS